MKRVESATSDLSEKDPTHHSNYRVSKSRLVKLINWVHVARSYLPFLWYAVMSVLVFQLLTSLYALRFDLMAFLSSEMSEFHMQTPLVLSLGWKTMAVLACLIWYSNHREKAVYLLDFECFEPPANWKLSPDDIMTCLRHVGCYNQESLDFMEKMLQRSGVGPATAWPPGIVRCLEGKPQDTSMEAARIESKEVMCTCVRDLLQRTGVKAKDISILVINCSLFSPTPSLCSMVANEFNMRPDLLSYNLSGMGCSAGIISIDLVKHLLAGKPNSLALVVSTENLTQALYHGNDRAFLVQNTLFRCGGAAVLLSNRWLDAYRASFKLLHTVRTQYLGEGSFGCVYQTQDAEEGGHMGVRLSKDIVKIAGRALEKNFTALGPYVLPLSEQFKTIFSMIARAVVKQWHKRTGLGPSKIDPYIPDFKRGIDHFCIHAGGRGVIDGIEKNLSLQPKHVEASRYALYTYGNTSSSSIWYEMDYIRSHSTRLKRGQRVLQVAFGSGFKCNSAVWLCINNKRQVSKELKYQPEDMKKREKKD